MSLDINAIIDAISSSASALGLFERVNEHEPKNAPGNGLTCAIWAESLRPYASGSGLNSTTGLLTMNVRLYTSMTAEPYDLIDPNLLNATSSLINVYSGDFELGGQVKNVDLLGATGTPLSARAGYLEIDKKILRVMTITLPLVINDVWDQAP
jgi:hypothetical protein